MASVYILGAGAMGGLWATHLHQVFKSQTEHSVQFLSTRKKSAERLQFSLNSPFLSSKQTLFNIELPLCSPSQMAIATEAQPNIILLCTKSYHALEAAVAIRPKLNPHCYLVLFQNGLGSQHRILSSCPDNPIFAAVSTEGVNTQTKGHLVHAGKGLTRVGPLNKAAQKPVCLAQCLEILSHPGLTVQPEENIWPALWEKLAINCAINPFTAMLNCPNGEIINSSLFKENWPELKRELSTMLQMADVALNCEELEARIFQVIENTRNNISSMLQDVRAKRKTEIEDINGFAASYLEQQGMMSKVNNLLYRQVSDLEQQ